MTHHDQVEPQDELSERLSEALGAAPRFAVPAGFAARTAVRAVELSRAGFRARFSRMAIQGGFAALLVAMLVCARWVATPSVVPMAVELVLACEFVALSTWLSLRTEG